VSYEVREPRKRVRRERRLRFPWCLLFGYFYFAAKEMWAHAIFAAILAVMTLGLSWFIYPFAASAIVREHYLRMGWREQNADAGVTTWPHE
jgi:hypothetical protein